MKQRLTEAPSWHALPAHYEKVKDIQLRQLFAGDPSRGERLAAEAAGFYLDYSKNRITDETIRLLIQLAQSGSVADRRDAMFRGEKINITEVWEDRWTRFCGKPSPAKCWNSEI